MLPETNLMQFAVPFIRFGQCLGLSPFHMNHGRAFLSHHRYPFILISIILFSIQLFHLILSFVEIDFWLKRQHAILAYIYFVAPIIVRTQVFVMLIEIYLKRSTQVNIINLLNSLNKILTKNLKIKNNFKKLQKIIWFMVFCILFDYMLTLTVYFMKRSPRNKYYNLFFLVPSLLRIPYHNLLILYIYSLLYNIQLINDRLRTIQIEIQLFGFEENHFYRELIYFRKSYSVIWNIIKLIEFLIHWGVLISFMYNLMSIITALYWSFMHFFTPNLINNITFASGIIYCFGSFLEIFQFCDACNRVVNAVSWKFYIRIQKNKYFFLCIIFRLTKWYSV